MSRGLNKKILGALSILAAIVITVLVFAKSHQDTILQLEAEQEVNEALTAVIRSTEHGLVITNEKGIVIEWNPAMEKLTGYSRDESVGQDIHRLMDYQKWVEHQKKFDAAIQRVRVGKTKDDLSVVFCDMIRSDGVEVPVRASVRVYKSTREKIYSFSFISPQGLVRILPEGKGEQNDSNRKNARN